MGRNFQDHTREVTAKLVRERFPIDPKVQGLINLAAWDLWNGPISGDDEDAEDYPGFSSACDAIREALEDVQTVYVDMQFESLSDALDEGYEDDETGEWIEPYLEDTYEVDRDAVLSILVGKELAEYVR